MRVIWFAIILIVCLSVFTFIFSKGRLNKLGVNEVLITNPNDVRTVYAYEFDADAKNIIFVEYDKKALKYSIKRWVSADDKVTTLQEFNALSDVPVNHYLKLVRLTDGKIYISAPVYAYSQLSDLTKQNILSDSRVFEVDQNGKVSEVRTAIEVYQGFPPELIKKVSESGFSENCYYDFRNSLSIIHVHFHSYIFDYGNTQYYRDCSHQSITEDAKDFDPKIKYRMDVNQDLYADLNAITSNSGNFEIIRRNECKIPFQCVDSVEYSYEIIFQGKSVYKGRERHFPLSGDLVSNNSKMVLLKDGELVYFK